MAEFIEKIKSPWIFKIRESQEKLVNALVDAIEVRLRKRLSTSNLKPIGLATGRTMKPVYEKLVLRLKDWHPSDLKCLLESWHSFNLDEYVGLGIDDETSFLSFMKRSLARPLGITTERFSLPNGKAKNIQQEACNYLSRYNRLGGVSFQLLGLGLNGHIGFNEPPSNPNDSCRVVDLSFVTRKQNSFAFNHDETNVPLQAITLGLNEILMADEIHLVVLGKEKAHILKTLLSSSISDMLPASWLTLHRRPYLWADYDAFQEFITELRPS